MGLSGLAGESCLHSAVAVETIAIDRLLMMQPDSAARDFAFVRARGLLGMSEGLSAMTVTPGFHTVIETVEWKVPNWISGEWECHKRNAGDSGLMGMKVGCKRTLQVLARWIYTG